MTLEFQECALCAEKPGSPLLCGACLWNRMVIEKLTENLSNLRKLCKVMDELEEQVAKLHDN